MTKLRELFGQSTDSSRHNWDATVTTQHCPFLGRKCLKNRKSEPDIAIGTCTVTHGGGPVVICPYRFLERRVIFTDCLSLVRHEPGNELHVVPEVSIPGGTVDYLCAPCGRSYDRARLKDSTTWGLIVWAVRRSCRQRPKVARMYRRP